MARKCVQALDLQPEDSVLEIGPGKGILTKHLIPLVKNFRAVEIDPALFQNLKNQYESNLSVEFIGNDFLEVSFSDLHLTEKFKVIGNLPYAVVSPILQKLIEWDSWICAVVMVQKEVGDRMLAAPDNKNYGILSVSLQSRCKIKKVTLVPGSCFRPEPKVQSMVLKLAPLEQPLFEKKNEQHFFTIVKASFAHRRKTILNSLTRSLGCSVEKAQNALSLCKISGQVRAETLSIDQFCQLSDAFLQLK